MKSDNTPSRRTEEENSSFSENADDNEWCILSRSDLIPLIAAIFSILLCLTTSLLSFYLVQAQEVAQAKVDLAAISLTGQSNLQKAVYTVTITTANLQAFVTLSDSVVNQYTQFEPFVYSTGAFPEYIFVLMRAVAVPDNQTNQFLSEFRTWGPEYAVMIPFLFIISRIL